MPTQYHFSAPFKFGDVDWKKTHGRSEMSVSDKFDVLSAAFARENTIAGAWRYGQLQGGVEEGFSPYSEENMKTIRGAGHNPEDYTQVVNSDDFYAMHDRIEEQRAEDRDFKRMGGWSTGARIAGAVTDPTTIAAIIATPALGSERLAAIALRTGLQDVAFDALRESVLHTQQVDRTWKETAAGLGFTAFGSVGMAAALGKFSGAGGPVIASVDDLYAPKGGKTAGVASAVSTAMRKYNSSDSNAFKASIAKMENLPIFTQGNFAGHGVGPTVGGVSNVGIAKDAKSLLTGKEGWSEFRQAKGSLTQDEYWTEITRGLANGDKASTIALNGTELNKAQVAAIQKGIDATVPVLSGHGKIYAQYGRIENEAYAEALAKGERVSPKGAQTYAPAIPRADLVRRTDIRDNFSKLYQEKFARLHSGKVMIAAPKGKLIITDKTEGVNYLTSLPEAKMIEDPAEMAEATWNRYVAVEDPADLSKIHGMDPQATEYRAMDVLDYNDMLGLQMIETDPNRWLPRASRQAHTYKGFMEVFGKDRMDDVLIDIANDYKFDIPSKGKIPTAKEIDAAFAKQGGKAERDKDFLLSYAEAMRGVTNRPDPDDILGNVLRTGNEAVMAYNVPAVLGGAVLTNLTDLAGMIMFNGFKPMSILMNRMFGHLPRKELIAQANSVGLALQKVQSNRMRQIAEGAHNFTSSTSKIDKGTAFMYEKWGKYSLMEGLTDFSQVYAGNATITNAYKDLGRWNKLKPSVKARHANAGLTEQNARAIKSQMDKHGEMKDGVFFANLDKWDDSTAKVHFESYVNDAVTGRQTLFPKIGDKPILKDDEYKFSGLLMQFQHFNLAATNRYLLAGMQLADARVLGGAMTMLMLGHFVSTMKGKALGRDQDYFEIHEDQNGVGAVVDAADRSGLLGIIGPAMPALLQATGYYESNRYVERSPLSMVTGPTYGVVGQVPGKFIKAYDGEFQLDDARNLPFMNTLHLLDMLRIMDRGYGWRDNGY
jgi:hypothetical protein